MFKSFYSSLKLMIATHLYKIMSFDLDNNNEPFPVPRILEQFGRLLILKVLSSARIDIIPLGVLSFRCIPIEPP